MKPVRGQKKGIVAIELAEESVCRDFRHAAQRGEKDSVIREFRTSGRVTLSVDGVKGTTLRVFLATRVVQLTLPRRKVW